MEYLIEHAKENIWCTLGMDYQCTFKLTRLTKVSGEKKSFAMEWNKYELPNNKDFFHCFMFGHIPKSVLGITEKLITYKWYRLNDLMTDNITILNVHFGDGLEIAHYAVYLLINTNRGVLIAIKNDSIKHRIDNNDVYLRIYKNRYFESYRQNPEHEKIIAKGITEFNNTELFSFISECQTLYNLDYGRILICIEGFWYRNISSMLAVNSTGVDYIFDGSIKDIIEYNVSELKSFVSERDELSKYVIHLSKIYQDGITFFDDLDIFIGHDVKEGGFKGIRLVNNKYYIRQLTHNDYSITVDAVSLTHKKYFSSIDLNDMKLYIVTRYSGYDRPLWYVSDKIRALYKMSNQNILDAMLGVDSNVNFWQAKYLETGSYAELMTAKNKDVNLDLVVRCYGYRGIAKALADSPIKTDSSMDITIQLPYNFRESCLAIEYDKEGILLDTFQSKNQYFYSVTNNSCSMIELMRGIADNEFYQGYDQKTFKINNNHNYRFFKKEKGAVNNDWIDVTNSSDYSVSNDTVTWNIDIDSYTTTALCDNNLYWFEDDLSLYKNIIIINLKSYVNQQWIEDYIHLNHYRVWLNNRALIRDIDFKLKADKLYIVNKEYIDSKKSEQSVLIVADGLIKDRWFAERGYVINDYISFDKRYEYYDDRLIRVVVGGKVFSIDDMLRPENSEGNFITLDNGLPYLVENISLSIKLDEIDLASLYDDALNKEKIIDDYLTVKIPQEETQVFDTIPKYYTLYSPFLASIIFDLTNDILILSDEKITDIELDTVVSPYKKYLTIDPSTWKLDSRYITIHPHPYYHTITVTQLSYSVLERLNTLYLNNSTDLTPFLQINSET